MAVLCTCQFHAPSPQPRGGWGNTWGFDKLSRQMPHPWDQVGCQIPTMSSGDLTAHLC